MNEKLKNRSFCGNGKKIVGGGGVGWGCQGGCELKI